MTDTYIHGSSAKERQRLALMNDLINQRCLLALELGNERLVLDVGCGTGQFSRLMAAALPPGSTVIAVEHNPDQVQAALQLTEESTGGCAVDFRIGDAQELPLEDTEMGQFDLAHTRFLLEHVHDPAAVVRAMVAAVRPGGRVVLLDDDHELMRFWPEPEGVMAAWKAYYRSYSRLRNDALVGRKLALLLADAGAPVIRIDQLFYGACAGMESFTGVVDNLIGVLQGARFTVLSAGEISKKDYDAALRSLRRFRDVPNAAVWYVVNLAEGKRRKE
ncbi:MAG: class I SAM-dependent methyltransferase [Lysobacterales bacterium]